MTLVLMFPSYVPGTLFLGVEDFSPIRREKQSLEQGMTGIKRPTPETLSAHQRRG